MNGTDDTKRLHPVIVAVCVASEGVDRKDAVNVAEAAVRKAVGAELTVSIPWIGTDTDVTRTVHVSYVGEVNRAARDRWLTVGTAPPRSFGAELMRRQGPPFGVGNTHAPSEGRMKLVDSLVPLAGVLSGTAVGVLGIVAVHDGPTLFLGLVVVIFSVKWWRDAYIYE